MSPCTLPYVLMCDVVSGSGAISDAAVFPHVGGKEWYFQDAVGVDCSSPEPRCIWVAVLHGDTPQINVSNLQNDDPIESTNGINASRALPRPSQTCRVSCFVWCVCVLCVCVCVCVVCVCVCVCCVCVCVEENRDYNLYMLKCF